MVKLYVRCKLSSNIIYSQNVTLNKALTPAIIGSCNNYNNIMEHFNFYI